MTDPVPPPQRSWWTRMSAATRAVIPPQVVRRLAPVVRRVRALRLGLRGGLAGPPRARGGMGPARGPVADDSGPDAEPSDTATLQDLYARLARAPTTTVLVRVTDDPATPESTIRGLLAHTPRAVELLFLMPADAAPPSRAGGEVAALVAEAVGHPNARAMVVEDVGNPAAALAAGLGATGGDVVVVGDAACVGPGWVQPLRIAAHGADDVAIARDGQGRVALVRRAAVRDLSLVDALLDVGTGAATAPGASPAGTAAATSVAAADDPCGKDMVAALTRVMARRTIAGAGAGHAASAGDGEGAATARWHVVRTPVPVAAGRTREPDRARLAMRSGGVLVTIGRRDPDDEDWGQVLAAGRGRGWRVLSDDAAAMAPPGATGGVDAAVGRALVDLPVCLVQVHAHPGPRLRAVAELVDLLLLPAVLVLHDPPSLDSDSDPDGGSDQGWVDPVTQVAVGREEPGFRAMADILDVLPAFDAVVASSEEVRRAWLAGVPQVRAQGITTIAATSDDHATAAAWRRVHDRALSRTPNPRLVVDVHVPVAADGTFPGSAHVRVLRPLWHPAVTTHVLPRQPGHDRALTRKHPTDLVHVQRNAVAAHDLPALLAFADQRGAEVVVDLDDDLFDPDLPAPWPQYAPTLAELVQQADLLTVSTPELADRLARRLAHRGVPNAARGAGRPALTSPRIEVVPNAIDETLWIRDAPPMLRAGRPGHLDVLYMGTRTHADDLALLREPLERARESSGCDIRLHLVGVTRGPSTDWYEAVTIPPGRGSHDRFVPWLVGLAGRFDLAVAPLVDTPFNQAKSDLKFLEYSAMGLPGIYSRVRPYLDTVTDGVDGLLVDADTASWTRAFVAMTDPVVRGAIGTQARAHVRRRLLARTAPRLRDLLTRGQ